MTTLHWKKRRVLTGILTGHCKLGLVNTGICRFYSEAKKTQIHVATRSTYLRHAFRTVLDSLTVGRPLNGDKLRWRSDLKAQQILDAAVHKPNFHLQSNFYLNLIYILGMMPLWLFTLGKTIFDKGNLRVPYERLTTYVIGMLIPLAIGLMIQRFLPRVARFLTRILKTISLLLIIFIVVFAIVTNLYLFQLLKWKVNKNC